MRQDRGFLLYQTEIVSVSSILHHYVINGFKNYEKYYTWFFFIYSIESFSPQWHFVITKICITIYVYILRVKSKIKKILSETQETQR